MLICKKCNTTLKRLPIEKFVHYELDYPVTEYLEVNYCENCGARDYIQEASRCMVCGGFSAEYDERSFCICKECVDQYKTVENALKIGNEYPCNAEINEFVATIFTNEEINNILIDYVKSNYKDLQKAKEYCEQDPFWFEEWIEMEYPQDTRHKTQ